jgi:hypothetical protein
MSIYDFDRPGAKYFVSLLSVCMQVHSFCFETESNNSCINFEKTKKFLHGRRCINGIAEKISIRGILCRQYINE